MSDGQQLTSDSNARTIVDDVPVDILLCWTLLGAAYLVGSTYPGSPLQVVVAAPVLFFLPGYVTVAAAFPHHGRAPPRTYGDRVSVGERFALAFGVSIVVLPLLGLIASALPWGITAPVLGGLLGSYVVAVGVVAGFLRLRLPAQHRYDVPLGRWAQGLSREFSTTSPLDRVVTLALCLSVILAVGVAGYALAVPNDGEQFTDFHLVTEGDDGEAVSANYPTELTEGQSATYTVGVENHERETMEYEVVVTLDRVVESDGDQRVIESNELERMDQTVGPGERWTDTHEVTPGLTGENLRLTYHLYVDEAPEQVSRDSAYRHLQIWVDVDG